MADTEHIEDLEKRVAALEVQIQELHNWIVSPKELNRQAQEFLLQAKWTL